LIIWKWRFRGEKANESVKREEHFDYGFYRIYWCQWHYKILQDYSTEMLDQMIGITSGALIISYSLYTFLADNSYMMLMIPFAVYGLFRYLFLVHAKNFGGETEMIFKDKGILICMVLWAVLAVAILYGYSDKVIQFVGGV